MANQNHTKNDKKLLEKLGNFSKNMTHHHHLENLSEFVLHDMCSTELFSLPKAAYLVNNPDFTCLKGVSGYHMPESFLKGESWQNQKEFTAHMNKADFNQKVRMIQDRSLLMDGKGSERSKIYSLADQLQINDPLYHIWPMKYENHGVLIFERPEDIDLSQQHLLDFLYMLSFCPVF
jgi:hypothetical protein